MPGSITGSRVLMGHRPARAGRASFAAFSAPGTLSAAELFVQTSARSGENGLLRNGWWRRVAPRPFHLVGCADRCGLVGEDVLVAKGFRPVDRDQQFLLAPDMRE
ncbi:hypothetical protein, partial [Nocardia nova]|uniref:hypothetical protein n=1 Tax=Nocardia nova TaxID=37330 RepID=UPI001E4A6CE9